MFLLMRRSSRSLVAASRPREGQHCLSTRLAPLQEQGAPIETDTERYRRLKSLSERAEDSITPPMTRAAIHVSGAVQVYKHEGKPHARFATAIRTFLERDQQRLAVCHQSQTNVGRFT